ncbi:MAG: hypothetical protein B6D55_05390 [Candidatus Omnitrophica bacterium 4484_70.2]|nr:MAG: hypothetical protein B6D55_05390 [Candidatus Omnitrophica bacterium 4484_70.2]
MKRDSTKRFLLGIIILLNLFCWAQQQESSNLSENKSLQKNEEEISQNIQSVQETSILEIEQSKEKPDLFTIELKNADLADFFRVLAHNYHLNIIVDEKVKGKITASFTEVTLEEALERIVDMYGLKLERKGNVIFIKPNLVTKIFYLSHIEAKSLLEISEDETQMQETSSETEETVRSRAATIYDLLSEEGKVLLGKQPNSIMVIDYPENIEKIKTYIEMVDKGMSSRIFKLKYISAKEIVGKLKKSEEETEESEETTESNTEGSSNETE